MKPVQLSKRAGFLLATALTVSLVLIVGPAPVTSLPVSSSSSASSSHGSDYSYPDRHASPPAPASAPPSKSDTLVSSPSSSILVSPDSRHPRILVPVAQGVGQEPPAAPITHETAHDGIEPSPTPITPKQPPKPINKNAFRILNPAPNDVWTSGKIETMSWEDLDLPDHVTYDITLIPEDPVSNPKALLLTRRPILRYVIAEDRFLDIVAPYDLISREQLLKVQESNVNFTWTQPDPTPSPVPTPVEEALMETAPSSSPRPSPSPSPASEAIDSRARLYITAYVGKTNKMIAQKSVYPLIIRKDPKWDRREPQPNALVALPTSLLDELDEDLDAGHPEDMLEKKDSGLAHLDDRAAAEGDHHQVGGHEHADGDSDMEEDEDEGEEGEEHHHHTFGSWVTETFDDWKEQGTEEEGEEAAEGGVDEIEEENALNAHTPTSDETGENFDSSDTTQPEDDSMHMHSHPREGGESESEEDEEEGEGGHHHDHSHVIDPNHFQNDADVAIWEEHADEPGYNPPITIKDAGTINITRWIDNKERFFVGAPYVMAWTFPEESEGLTGTVNIYIEDAETAQRYDIAAGDLPSDVRFIYLRPSALLVSAIPKKRIFVRARVEMDLFWAGTIQRYTGFSKTFYVERGAL
ncbi:hypothetical protein BGZ47_008665 [Haplosporangium gracile]|nr:hypothetical protein BGZ47_008665 [Haplosporangium gracile]